MARRRAKHLYSEASKEDFERRYGKEHGDLVYGETIGKVSREQAAVRPMGVKVEHVRGHIALSDRGARFRVRSHDAYVHAAPHPLRPPSRKVRRRVPTRRA